MAEYLDPTPPIWEYMDEPARKAYERIHGVGPPGYRATGSVEWFQRSHPDEAPCISCGKMTDRFPWFGGRVGDVSWGQKHVDQKVQDTKGRAICADAILPYCWPCERLAEIAKLEQRLTAPDVHPEAVERIKGWIAGLKEEIAEEAEKAA